MPIARETRREAELLDAFAECMGHEHRRKILFLLHDPGSGDRLLVPGDLQEGDADRDALLVELVHHHLPKLEESGYVSWDREGLVVEKGDAFERIEPLLDVLTENYDRIVPRVDRPGGRR